MCDDGWKVGDRVTFWRDVERYPHFTVSAGISGVVADVDVFGHGVWVLMDDHIPGAETWDNEVFVSRDDDLDALVPWVRPS